MDGFGSRLKALRGKKSTEEVGKDLGISASSIRMYEAELRTPRDDVKIALAKYYGTTVEDIFFPKECHK